MARRAKTAVPVAPTIRTPREEAAHQRALRLRAALNAKLAEQDAEIARLFAAIKTASTMWVAGAVRAWENARERRAGYADAMNDIAFAMLTEREEEEP